MEMIIDRTVDITERCVEWCASQHIAHYGNEIMLIPKIILASLFIVYMAYRYGAAIDLYCNLNNLHWLSSKKLAASFLLFSLFLICVWLWWFKKTYGG